MATTELSPDQKGLASLTFKEVIKQTRENFPDPRYWPIPEVESKYYAKGHINPSPHTLTVSADGIGTKPELIERLAVNKGSLRYLGDPARDTVAMVESDAARNGHLVIAIVNVADVTSATTDVISALSQGFKRACDDGKFALLDGETAELGYRVSGAGDTRFNINAFALALRVEGKVITGQNLAPGQPLVGLRENSIRSNGLTLARKILDLAYLQSAKYSSKKEYALENLYTKLEDMLILSSDRKKKLEEVDHDQIISRLDSIMGHSFLEQVLLPWHESDLGLTKVVQELVRPSILYSRLIYEAQGGVDDPRMIDITGAAHISGGGVPEKVGRMLQPWNLGAEIRAVFPDPLGVRYLFELAEGLTDKDGKPILDDRGACQQWNRGIGFLMVTQGQDDAKRLIELATSMGYEAAEVGKVIEEPVIKFRGHTWNY